MCKINRSIVRSICYKTMLRGGCVIVVMGHIAYIIFYFTYNSTLAAEAKKSGLLPCMIGLCFVALL